VNERQELLKRKCPEGLPLDGRKPNMSGAAQQAPKFSDVHELMILLANLLDAAQQLSPGPERTAAFEQIRDFQRRLATFLRDE
jgi:hypothetical protein